MRRLGVSIAAGLGALALLAPPAIAGTQGPTVSLGFGGTLEYLRTKYPQVVTQAGPVTNCTPGDFVVGGGASISGSGAIAHLNSSAPLDPGEGWVAEGRASGINGRTVTGWAICGGAEPTLSSTTEVLDAGASHNASLPCPGNASRLSAGVDGDGGDVRINGLFPLETGGLLTSFENAGATQGTARASLLCADVQQRFRAATEQVDSQRAQTVIATCAETQVVVGGGVRAIRKGVWQRDVWALAVRPWDSPDDSDKTPEDGWLVKSYNGTPRRIALTAYASCLKL